MTPLADRLRVEALWVGSALVAPRTKERLEAIALEIEQREAATTDIINSYLTLLCKQGQDQPPQAVVKYQALVS